MTFRKVFGLRGKKEPLEERKRGRRGTVRRRKAPSLNFSCSGRRLRGEKRAGGRRGPIRSSYPPLTFLTAPGAGDWSGIRNRGGKKKESFLRGASSESWETQGRILISKKKKKRIRNRKRRSRDKRKRRRSFLADEIEASWLGWKETGLTRKKGGGSVQKDGGGNDFFEKPKARWVGGGGRS